jgi:two-component system, response regulator, stage 0 sporulation protein F
MGNAAQNAYTSGISFRLVELILHRAMCQRNQRARRSCSRLWHVCPVIGGILYGCRTACLGPGTASSEFVTSVDVLRRRGSPTPQDHSLLYSYTNQCILGGRVAKLLVIDDEQGIRNLLDTLLSRKGYDVVLADGGRKGLELIRRERPDVVVLDLKMPGMDGLAVLQQVRSLNPKQPVIILTGAGTPETEQQVGALGVTEYIEKEFSLHRLGDSLKCLLKTPDPAT